jgi:hypothetical protein
VDAVGAGSHAHGTPVAVWVVAVGGVGPRVPAHAVVGVAGVHGVAAHGTQGCSPWVPSDATVPTRLCPKKQNKICPKRKSTEVRSWKGARGSPSAEPRKQANGNGEAGVRVEGAGFSSILPKDGGGGGVRRGVGGGCAKLGVCEGR